MSSWPTSYGDGSWPAIFSRAINCSRRDSWPTSSRWPGRAFGKHCGSSSLRGWSGCGGGAAGGAQVRDPDPRTLARYASLLLQFEGATLEDVHRARILIEPPAARWLVEHPDQAAITGQLSDALRAENASRDNPEELARMEGHFHQLVTRLTGNETLALLCAVSNLIVAHHVDRFFENRRRIKRDAGAGFDAAHRADARLVEMIAAGDGREVEQLWRRHLEEALVSLRPLGRMTVLELMS